jgi:hypothetical protein
VKLFPYPEALETALLQRTNGTESISLPSESQQAVESSGEQQTVVGILALLARELQKLNSNSTAQQRVDSPNTPGLDHAVHSPTTSNSSRRHAYDSHDASHGYINGHPRKRRRVDSCGNPNIELALPFEDLENISSSLPPAELMEDIITVYFTFIQPWIPILHETQFRRRIHDPDQIPKLVVILHAMVASAIRYVDKTNNPLSAEEMQRRAQRSRNIVILTAMDHLSVENLQALIIVAFNDVSSLSLTFTRVFPISISD